MRRSVGIRNSLNRIVIGGKTRLTFRKMVLNPSFMARIIYEKIDRVSFKRHKYAFLYRYYSIFSIFEFYNNFPAEFVLELPIVLTMLEEVL
jgi:hypothetical protein